MSDDFVEEKALVTSDLHMCDRVDQLPLVPCGRDGKINPIVGVYIPH